MPFLLIPVVALALGLYLVHKKAQENAAQQVSVTTAPPADAAPVTPGGVVAAAATPAAPGAMPVGGLFGGIIVPQKAPTAPQPVVINLGAFGQQIAAALAQQAATSSVTYKIAQAAFSIVNGFPSAFTNDPYGLNRETAIAAVDYLQQHPSLANVTATEKTLSNLSSPEAQAAAQTLHTLFNV